MPKGESGRNHTTVTIELQRDNVTVSQFLSYIKSQAAKKGIDIGVDRDIFTNPHKDALNTSYFVRDGKKIVFNNGYKSEWDATDAACQAETIRTRPYDYQTYVLNFDGTHFNEICEFSFDDEKRGYGYYYYSSKTA